MAVVTSVRNNATAMRPTTVNTIATSALFEKKLVLAS